MLVSGLRQRLARTICQHPLTCSPKSPKRLLTQRGAIIWICKNSTLSSLSPPPLLSVVFFCSAFSPPQAVPVDALAQMCFSLLSIVRPLLSLLSVSSLSLSLLSRSFSLSSPLFLLLTEDSLLSSLFVFVGPLHLSRSSSSFCLFHFFSLYFYIFIFVLPFHLSHSSSIFFLYSPLDPLANELEQ